MTQIIVTFTPADIPDHIADAAAFIEEHGKYIRDALIEAGNRLIDEISDGEQTA